MTSREDLIEEAAKAIYDASWQGFEGEVFSDVYARIAFDVFEQAQTATEDYPDAEWHAARTPQVTNEMVLAAVAAFRDGSFGNDYIDMRIALEAALGQTNDTKEPDHA